jgi:hypothetical protein
MESRMPENESTTTDEQPITDDASAATDAEGTEVGDGDANPDGADQLGDAGKKALDSMKGKWREERDKRRDLEARLSALESAPKGESTDEPTADQIRAQAAREATEKANARILRSEVKAAAAGKFADPSDVALYLDLTKFEVDENGDVDTDEINDAIEDLLTRKPHLAATARPRFQGSGDGGAARKATGPTQLTREQLEGMTPEAIVKAKREGRLTNLLTGK